MKRSGSRKSHLYLVHTLVTKYLYGLKNGTLAKIIVYVSYPGSKKIYPTPLNKLFINVKNISLMSREASKQEYFLAKPKFAKIKKVSIGLILKKHCLMTSGKCAVLLASR